MCGSLLLCIKVARIGVIIRASVVVVVVVVLFPPAPPAACLCVVGGVGCLSHVF